MITSFITLLIAALIVILFIRSIDTQNERNYKSEIVSLGILGTFIGIAVGLFHFDVTDIQKSVPQLLEGLKTAFITSGLGIFFSIVLSIMKPAKKQRSETLEALETVVQEFNNNLTQQFGGNFKQLNESVKQMVQWQENYKSQIKSHEESIETLIEKLDNIEVTKKQEQEQMQQMMQNLTDSTRSVKNSLEDTTQIVKEQMQLLLREANRSL